MESPANGCTPKVQLTAAGETSPITVRQTEKRGADGRVRKSRYG